jgi:large subunit ribosomal protein L10
MLTRTQKEELVNGLKEKIEKSNAVFLTNLIGLSSNDAVSLRSKLREVNGGISVSRNKLFKRASVGTSCEGMLSGLKGSNAIAFAFDDAAAVAKCLKEAGENFSEIVNIKAGTLRGTELSKEELVQLANLPGRDQMLATLLATFNAPISALARVLYAVQESKESGESSSENTVEAEVNSEN